MSPSCRPHPSCPEGPTIYLEPMNLTGRRELVTSGTAGIGLACAKALAEMVVHVTITDRD